MRNNGFIKEIPTMPGNLADLLQTCFYQNPIERPDKFISVVDSLKNIYRQCLGIEYSRDLRRFENRSSSKIEGTSRRTSEGLSWIDPQIWLEKALDFAGTPNEEKTAELKKYKQEQNESIVADIASYDHSKSKLIQIMESNNRDDLKPIHASLCINKSLIHQASGDMYGAINECDYAIKYLKDYALKYEEVEATIRLVHANFQKAKILQEFTSDHLAAFEAFTIAADAIELLVYKHQRSDLEDYLCLICSYTARSAHLAGKSAESIGIHDKVIRINEKSFNEDKRINSAVDLITAYIRKSMVLSSIDRNSEAADICDKAIQIYDRVNADGLQSHLDSELADIFATKASAIYNVGDIQNSLSLYSKAIEIKETLIQQESNNCIFASLSELYELKADILSETYDFLSAIELYKKATVIIENLIYQKGRNDLLENIATIYIKMAGSMRVSENNSDAYKLCDKAISIQEELINKKGKSDLSKYLAENYCLKAEILCDLGEMRQAIEWYYEALAIRDRLYTHNYNSEIAKDLASTYTNIGIVYTAIEEFEEAELILEKAIEMQELLHREGSTHDILGDLAVSKGHHALVLLSHGEIEELEERCARAMQEIKFSFKTLEQEFARTGRDDLKKAYNVIFWKFKENMSSTND